MPGAAGDLDALVELECQGERFDEEGVIVGDQHPATVRVPELALRTGMAEVLLHRGSSGKKPKSPDTCALAQNHSFEAKLLRSCSDIS
jgi:hypothetical protein